MKNEMNLITINLGKVLKTKRNKTGWIDIETRKKVLKKPFKMKNGEYLKRIWEPIAIGVGYIFENDFCIDVSYDWSSWIEYCNEISVYNDNLVYTASREFDEMILKGRFTNARRAHLEKQGPWGGINDDLFNWINITKNRRNIERKNYETDIVSKFVPEYWDIDREIVLLHLIRDVMWLAEIDYENKVSKNKLWNKIYYDNDFARRYISE